MTGMDLIVAWLNRHSIGTVSIVQVLESIATITAFAAALWWFYKKRSQAPRANIKHNVTFIDLKNGTTYVGIEVTITNTGNIAVSHDVKNDLTNSIVMIEELMPYISKHLKSQERSPEYKMKFLGSRTFPHKFSIEPGEEQSLMFEFVIVNSVKAIKVYSHLDNSYNEGIGWDKTTSHEVKYG